MPILDTRVYNELKDLLAEDLLEVIDMYYGDSIEQVAQLKVAVDAGDVSNIINICHSLKSSSANLGAVDLAELCKKMEELGREAKLDNPAELFEQLSSALFKTHEALKQES
jgi:HPt (histidine-containing phosphotransfer) domain-containing protein